MLFFFSILCIFSSHNAFGLSSEKQEHFKVHTNKTRAYLKGDDYRGKFTQLKQKRSGKNLFKTLIDNNEKKWNLSWNSSYSRGAHWLSKSRWSNNIGFSYKFEWLSVSIGGAYFYPLIRVQEPTYFGFTDVSLSGSKVIGQFKGWNIMGGLGVSLPTSERSGRQSKYSSLHGSISYKKKWSVFQIGFSHVFYGGLYGSRSDKSGYKSNPLMSTSHSVFIAFPYEKWVFSGTGRFYAYLYLADVNSNPSVDQIEFKMKGNQGASFRTAYNATRKWSVYGQTNLNIPIVSPVLTGRFPLTHDRNWQWSLGMALKL
ncbi:MAG: hypothetical protein OXB86_00325 [Bdellovibrionales bacterium]|nr:hypothetical protein [Bdellovibrionales bacterium]